MASLTLIASCWIISFTQVSSFCGFNQRRAAEPLQAEIRERHVGLNRHHLHHAFALTVLRHQRQPLFRRC